MRGRFDIGQASALLCERRMKKRCSPAQETPFVYFVVHPSPKMSVFRRFCVSIKAQQNAHNLCRAFCSRKTEGRTTHKTLRFDIRTGIDKNLHDLRIALLHRFVKSRIAAETLSPQPPLPEAAQSRGHPALSR